VFTETVSSKVTAAHLSRTALLYVRQSTLKQVLHNTESTIRQYDLQGRAIALGWTRDQITVIDIDQGHSGASAADREGFQQLVAEVSLGRAGIVLGLECSRLARNSADWCRRRARISTSFSVPLSGSSLKTVNTLDTARYESLSSTADQSGVHRRDLHACTGSDAHNRSQQRLLRRRLRCP
jgi:hypothetical protein